MQVTYNYIPETNHISRVYSVAAVLYLQFVLHVISPVKLSLPVTGLMVAVSAQ
jgi:hypothetical protein